MRIGVGTALVVLVAFLAADARADEAPRTLKEVAQAFDAGDVKARQEALDALLALARARYVVPWATFGPEEKAEPDASRVEVIARLDQALRDPALPIGPTWLSARALTARRMDDMAYGWGSIDGHPVLTREELALHLPRIERAMAQKRDAVVGTSLLLLLTYGHAVSGAGPIAARCWDHLEPHDQMALLREHWDRVRCDALEGVLRRRLVAPASYDPHRHVDDVPSWIVRRGLAFAPEKARALILQDLARAEPRFTTDALLALPDRFLPDLESGWVRRDEAGRWVGAAERLAPVLERYGTGDLVPRVHALLHSGSGSWGLDIQTHLLGYLLKHDPKRGLQEVKAALARRGRAGDATYRTVLERTLPRYWSRSAEELALKALEDEELVVARSAAFALVRAGSREALLPVVRWAAGLDAELGSVVPLSEGAARQQVLRELKAHTERWERAAEIRAAVRELLVPGEVDWLLEDAR